MKALQRALYAAKKRGKERAANVASKLQALNGEFVPEAGPWGYEARGPGEPTCDQLRTMWRLSKRHSRAAENTNEIPQYVDPFAAAHYAQQVRIRHLFHRHDVHLH